MRTTIRNRILFIFVGVFLVQALLMGSFFLHYRSKSNHNQVKQQLQSTAINISTKVSNFLNTALRDLETTSQQVERIAQKEYQRHHLLTTVKDNNPAFKALAFYDINGTVKSTVSSNNKNDVHKYFVENSTLFSFPYNTGKTYVTRASSLNNLPTIGIGIPVLFLNKSYSVGTIAALVPLNSIQAVLDRTVLPVNQNILIFDSAGEVIAEKLHEGTTHASFPLDMNWQEQVVIDHVRYISAATTLDFHGQLLTVASTINADKSITPSARSFMLLTLLIALLLTVSALVTWITNKRIIEPVQSLAFTSQALVEREEAWHSQPPQDVELQNIGKALQLISQQLHDSKSSFEQEVYKRRSQEKGAILARIESEKANQAKSIFLANMSHEIRTPLNAILGMFKMLEKDPLSTEQTRLLSMASIAGERLQSVVNSILDLSQIESGKFKLHHSVFSVSKLLSEVVEFMNIHAQEKGVIILSTQSPNIPKRLQGDSGRIRQILINLINNSIKFSEHGSINLKVERFFHENNDEVELLFCIADCGNGISGKDQQHIFDAFERGKVDSARIIEGTGLGLAISSEFVQHMGGKLWLDKTGPDGSTFCFTIRCTLAPEETFSNELVKENSDTEKPLLGIRVMLAEDEFINQRVISAILEEQGGHVTVCQNGEVLLKKMQQETADIVLMDIRMPVMDGLEATKIIRKQEADSALLPIPIVALTAQATTDFEEKCNEAGMDDYLTKPVPFDRLVETIVLLVKK